MDGEQAQGDQCGRARGVDQGDRDPHPAGQRMSPTFSSLSIYNYRVFVAGALISNTGTWMGRVAQDWLVLTQLTPHSSVALGIVTGLQFAPLALFAPVSGMIADRFPKRRILFATQSALALTSLLTGVLVVTGAVQLWHIFALAFIQAVAAFAVTSAVLALAPSYQWFAVLLIPVGLTALTVLTTANSMVQLSVAPALRGRVMALYMAVFMGGTPLGSPLIGWIGSAWGPRWTILVGSIATGLAVLAAMLYLVRSEDMHVRYHHRQRPRFAVSRGEISEPVPEVAS